MNNDSAPDLIIPSFLSHDFSVLLGDGRARFSRALRPPFPQRYIFPADADTGDLNGDGNLDVAVTDTANHLVWVFLGDGQGALSAGPVNPIPVGSFTPLSIVFRDFNEDGKLDVATANSEEFTVAILLGDGNGGLTPAPGSPFFTGDRLGGADLAPGDYNGDGRLDVAVGNFETVSVLLGDGNGGLAPAAGSPFPSPGGYLFASVVAGDFNGDGNLDVATGAGFGTAISVMPGDGNGALSLAPGSPMSVASGVGRSLASADFDGDGNLDLARTAADDDSVHVLLGDGAGRLTQAPGSPFATGGDYPQRVRVADFDCDRRPDLAIANIESDTVSVLVNNFRGAHRHRPKMKRCAQAPKRG
jgi:hypothetical protein